METPMTYPQLRQLQWNHQQAREAAGYAREDGAPEDWQAEMDERAKVAKTTFWQAVRKWEAETGGDWALM